jgi:hypothetical protein
VLSDCYSTVIRRTMIKAYPIPLHARLCRSMHVLGSSGAKVAVFSHQIVHFTFSSSYPMEPLVLL